MSSLSEFNEDRTVVSAMILEHQEYLKATPGLRQDYHELLRTFCERVTSRSREFAAKMGAADAVALKNS
jgi:HPt (histidine-containing phosphotransfer) domain-containing protein